MGAYIEVVGPVAMKRHDLRDWELRNIGDFTRENVLKWINSRQSLDWTVLQPAEDFHAVCGDIDIPWDTEKAKRIFQRMDEKGWPAYLS